MKDKGKNYFAWFWQRPDDIFIYGIRTGTYSDR